MIPVETVLRKLIVEFEFVILPGFGALLCHHIPARHDGDSGIFSPPMKKLAFNESLKLDDGLLANFISRHEQIPHQDAVVYIKSYIERLWALLESRGEARIAGIGTFGKNVEGKLVFDPGSESHFKNEWYGFNNVGARLAKSINAPRVISAVETEPVEETVEVLEDIDASGKWWKWAAAAMFICVAGYFSISFVSDNILNKSTLNPFSDLFEISSPKSKVVENKPSEPVSQIEEVLKSDAADGVQAAVEPVKIEDSAEGLPQPTEEISADRFFVVAGAFKGTKQANVLLEQIKVKGYPNAVLILADSSNSKVKVAVEDFGSEEEAHLASRKLIDIIGEAGWVYRQKGDR